MCNQLGLVLKVKSDDKFNSQSVQLFSFTFIWNQINLNQCITIVKTGIRNSKKDWVIRIYFLIISYFWFLIITDIVNDINIAPVQSAVMASNFS